jgi:colanic acid/amylovoran biosynthesis glycosyltransferase
MPSIAHCVARYLPITQTWIYSQLIHLKRYRPVVFAGSLENLEIFPFQPIFTYESECVPRQILPKLPLYPPSYAEVFKRAGLYLPGYAELFKRSDVALLHAHFGDEAFRLLAIKTRLKLPLITSFYGYDVSLLPRLGRLKLWRPWLRLLFAMGDLFLVEGTHMRDCLVELGCPTSKVIVRHLGVDVTKLVFHPRTPPDHGSIRVLLAGGFREKKGTILGIEAFSRVVQERPDLELAIVGDGPLRPFIEARIEELKLGSKVKLWGYQSYDVLYQIMSDSHIFLAPSMTASDGDTEGGAPVVLIEAQAMGMPVVSTYHADIPEVVVNEKTGFLARERDVQDISEKLCFLVTNPELWVPMGEAGRAWVEKSYNLHKQVKRLEEIYENVLDNF